jgi:hypothetical protein
MSENSQQDHAKAERAKNQSALLKFLGSRSAEIEARRDPDHSMTGRAKASQAIGTIRRLAILLDDPIAVDEIKAKADALEATLNLFQAEKPSLAAHSASNE